MTDIIIRIGAVKLGLSLVLALLAWSVGRAWNRPQLTYMLWLLVLLTMLTPALFSIQVADVSALAKSAATDFTGLLGFDDKMAATSAPNGSLPQIISIFGLIWLGGSVIVLCWSLLRIYRFNRLLSVVSRPAPYGLHVMASQIATQLGLRNVPSILIAEANVSPLVWWLGGQPRVVIPAALAEQISDDELRWMMAHELAHVRRRDHIVRWIEWIACVAFWWNPVTWWARRSLRSAEEMCCDALALSTSNASARGYARSLLAVVDFLSAPSALHPPALASGAAAGGRTTNLERRIRMIISEKSRSALSRRGRAALWTLGAGIFTLGLLNFNTSAAQVVQSKKEVKAEQSCEEVMAKLKAAVVAGAISEEEAKGTMVKCAPRAKVSDDERRIKESVEAGLITPEQGKEKLAKVMDARKKADEWYVMEKKPKPSTIESRLDCEKVVRAIADALTAGVLTVEQAREKLSVACR